MKTSKQSILTFSLTLLAALIMTALPDLASAAVTDPIGKQLCNIAKWFSSDTGKAIATIAIVVLGIAAFFGKVTWGMALMFAIGIFAIFGASSIIEAVTDNKGSACSNY